MEQFIPVECFRKKRNTFRGIPFSLFYQCTITFYYLLLSSLFIQCTITFGGKLSPVFQVTWKAHLD